MTAEDNPNLHPDAKRLMVELNDRAAHAVHQNQREYQLGRRSEAWSAAQLALTSLATVNSGALVAILALVGSMLSSGRMNVPLGVVLLPLSIFAIRLFLVIAAVFLGYFAILSYIRGGEYSQFIFEHPYLVWTDQSAKWEGRAETLRWIAIGCCVASFVAVVAGSFAFIIFADAALSGLLVTI
jgi:hypothetical protein